MSLGNDFHKLLALNSLNLINYYEIVTMNITYLTIDTLLEIVIKSKFIFAILPMDWR